MKVSRIPPGSTAPLVLLVLDNPEMSAFVSETLAADYRIIIASDGFEGIEKSVALRPDLILGDAMTAGMSGDRLVSELRERPELEAVPIVVLMEKDDAELRARLLASGAQDYLTKPFSSEELRVRLGGLIKWKRAAEILRQTLASRSLDVEELALEVAARQIELQATLDEMVTEERNELLSREQDARQTAEAMTHRLEAVQIITEAALAHLSINELLDEMLTRIRGVLHVDTVAILLVEEEEGELVAWAAKGLEEEVERGVRIPIGKGFAGRIIARRQPIIIEDIDHWDVFNPLLREKGIKSLLGVPLMIEGRPTGVIHVGTLYSRRFTEEDMRLLQLIADRIALAIDHTRLYEVERKARAEAEEANRAKDEFLAMLSHELRTPLTPIVGWIHMMRIGSLSRQRTEHGLAVIDKNSQALTRIVSDLLDMSGILSGKMLIEQSPVPLAVALQEAVETVRAEAAQRAIEIEVVPFQTDGMVVVSGDRTRLVQVFWNLLYNAVKFSDKGTRVRVTCETDAHFARVHIEDQGKGISPDFLPFVFERFRQADASKTREHGGLGLGLALVKSFVEAHGGTVEATSAGIGRGSHFTVNLPRLRPERVSVTQLGAAAVPVASQTKDQIRVLVIEDALDTLSMLKVVFEIRGYEVTLCQTPTEALRVAASMWFDIIISDIGMPEIDGYELLGRLRELPHLREVPAVALTGYASPADAETAYAAGFDAHIAKPIDPNELAMRIDQLLQGRTPRQ